MTGEVMIRNETGLHARPASLFVNKARGYKSNIELILNNRKANAKSIMGVMGLSAGKGSRVIIKAEGEDEREAVTGLISFIKRELNGGENQKPGRDVNVLSR
ncbi:MAG: HPr family phosphocarrier protein [Halanaerobium sp.]|nr:HPr family phosphocarrier protein [Halanaerobium sp.]